MVEIHASASSRNTVASFTGPAPAQSRLNREAYRRSVETWLRGSTARTEGGTKSKQSHATALGLDKVVHTAFDARPRNPARKRRPYAFGSKENKRANYQQASQTYAAHRECSERFLAGQRDVVFPSGTYPPPIRIAA